MEKQTGTAASSSSVKGLVIQPWHLALAAALVVALVVGGIWLGTQLGGKDSDIDNSAEDFEWTPPEGGSNSNGGITLPGYPSLLLPAGERKVGIILPNPSNNPCYFRYRLTLQETGEVLYQSGLIPPGMAVKEIKLSRALPKGEYTLNISIETFSLADRTPMNGGMQDVPLSVK